MRSADVESRPLHKTQGAGHPGCYKSKSKAAGEGARATLPALRFAIGRATRHPPIGRLHFCFRRVSHFSRRQEIWDVKAGYADPVVGHPVIDVESVR
jgi:hypothetical protein